MKATADLIIKFRWLIIVGFIGITMFFASQIPKAKLNPDMMTYMPEDMPSRINKQKIEDLFGGTEMLMVLIKTDDVLKPETLKRVKKLSKQVKRVKGVNKVLSLFGLKYIRSEDGAMVVDPAVKRLPKTKEQRERLRDEIRDNDIVYGNVVSEDFTVTAVIAMVEPGASDEYLLGEVQKIIAKNPGEEEVVIGGTPYSRFSTGMSTKKDLERLLPVALLIMLIFLYFCFKQLRGVLLPFLVVIMSILVSMGLIPLLGWQITVITIILPVLLVAIANDYGIHLIAKYQEDNIPGNDYSKNELAKRMFTHLGFPVLLTGLTTVVGMLCLQGHILIPAGQLGILAAIAIAFALVASLFFIPAVTSLLPKPMPVILPEGNGREKPLLERLLGFFGNLVSTKPKVVIFGALIFTALASSGIFFVAVDTDPINYYDKDHPVAYSANLINDNLGGFFPVCVVFKGDIKEPRILKKIDRLEREIEKMPEIGNTTSIARVIRQMSRVLNDEGESGYDKIPDTRNAIAQYFELYLMSGDAEDFEKMVDFPYQHAIINARINTSSTSTLREVVDQINAMVKDDPDVQFVGGQADIFSDLAVKMVHGQFVSLAMALTAVSLLLMFLFRSVAAGLISAIPLALSMLIVFGLMGLFKIELNVATSLLSSIMIGVGIDYTIHFLWRYKKELQRGLLHREAVKQTLITTGRGITFNAFSVIIGFTALLLSGFVPVRFFGFLVVVSVFACLVGALMLIPAVCLVLKPKFLEPNKK